MKKECSVTVRWRDFTICVAWCTWIRQNMKETVPESIITWPVLGKQNIQAKKVYSYRVVLVHQHGCRFIVWNTNSDAVTESIKLTIGNNCLFLNRNPFWSWSRYCERQQHSLVSKCSYFDNLQVTGSTEPVARVTILGHNIVCIHTWQAKKLCTFILRQDLKWAWLSWWSFCFPFCW